MTRVNQTRLSLSVSTILGGLLMWQLVWPAPIEQTQATANTTAQAQKAPPPTQPKTAQENAVVMLPPPPVLLSPVLALKSPEPEIAEPAQIVAALKPITPAPVSRPVVPLDLLHNRQALKPSPAPEPMAQKAPPLQPLKHVAPRIIEKPTQKARPEPVQHANAKTASTGRALLRVLEHGKGPSIQISWPDGTGARSALSQQLRRCFGMQLALMDTHGQLFVAENRRGESWKLNRDYYSGFVRQTAGRLPAAERQAASEIRQRHGAVGVEVHIFPRRVDALVLGALKNLTGSAYTRATTITAGYDLSDNRLRITGLRVDGDPVRGVIDLTGVRHCRGRST